MKKIRIVFVDKDFSRFAIFPLIGSFLIDFLKINKRLQIFSTKRHKIVFSCVDYCLTLISYIFLGIKNLNNIDNCLQTESKMAELIGIKAKVFPKRATCYNFLCSCTHWNIKQIDRINFDWLKEYSLLHKKRNLVVDIDQTTKSTEGIKLEGAKSGINTKHKGKPSLKYSISLVSNYILIIKRYKRCSFNSIRTKFIKLAGQISSEDEMTLIEISQRYRYKEALRYMLNRLNNLLSL